MKMRTLVLAMLVSFNVFGQDIRGSWRDQPLFSYEPSQEEIAYEEDLIVKSLKGTNHLSYEELNDLLDKYPAHDKSQIFISLKGYNKKLLALAAATSLGLVLLKKDDDLMRLVQGNKNDFTASISEFGYDFGHVTGQAPVVLGSFFLGVVLDNGKLKDIGIVAIGAGIATQIVTEGFKEVFGRERPNAGGAYEFFVRERNASFFSGHSSAAFSLATIISEVYGEQYPVVPYIAYGAAAITAFSRMHDNKHWGSDVIIGAIAGHLITKIIYRIYRGDDVPEEERWMSIAPWYEGRTGAIGFQVDYIPKKWR